MKKASYKSILSSYSYKSKGFDKKKNYSSFWMGDSEDWYSRPMDRFSGLSNTDRKSDDTVKAIKLNSYQRAISNFVTILTGKPIPVTFMGDTSYTDGKSVVISTDIKDDNFDVSVGLALHEASHIVLTNFNYLKAVALEVDSPRADNFDLWKNLLNWIEDRRIDNYIFKTSPGYRAYYHKMYDHYWNDKAITKGLQSANMRDPEDVQSYLFRIINSLNPVSDPTALPGLQEILNVIDVKTIARLKSVEDAGRVADQVLEILLKHIENPAAPEPKKEAGEGEEEPRELTKTEQDALEKAMKSQKDFLDGETPKKTGTKALTKKLSQVKSSGVEMQMVGVNEGKMEQACLIYDMTGDDRIARIAKTTQALYELEKHNNQPNASIKSTSTYRDIMADIREMQASAALPQHFNANLRDDYTTAIQEGLDMGGLLGKKLQLRDETRELVHSRLRSGHVDNRRLAQAGFGMETIFKQTLVSAHRKANLHISLDGSGSMSGERWANTAKMCAAIAKASTYVHNLDVQVSIRITTGNGYTPTAVYLYDSRKNPLNHLVTALKSFVPNDFTPEGLCFEGMLRNHIFIPGTRDLDSYLLNLSDGEPSGCKNYDGIAAYEHTKKIVQEMERKHNMGIISFFMHSYSRGTDVFNRSGGGRAFVHMYGAKNSHDVAANDAMGIAKTMNKKFLEMA